MAIIKGARNLDAAKKFYDWALTPDAQKIGLDVKEYAIPTNRSVPLPPQVPKLTDIKVIDYDFAKYGASDTRKRLLERWEKEVNAARADADAPSPLHARADAHRRARCCWLAVGAAGFAARAVVRAAGHRARRRVARATGPARTARRRCCRRAARPRAGSRRSALLLARRGAAARCARRRRARADAPDRVGASGFAYSLAQGFAIGPHGWSFEWLAALRPARRRPVRHRARRRARRRGVRDAVRARARRARLLQGRRVRRGQRRRASRVLVALFTFFPVVEDPGRRRCRTATARSSLAGVRRPAVHARRSGASAASPAARAAASPGTRCCSRSLCAAGCTALGLAFALIVTRTGFRYKQRAARRCRCCRSSRRRS